MQTTDQTETRESGSCPVPCYASYRDVYLNEAVVQHTLRSGGNAEDCVVALANMKAQLLQRVMELESIAPKKIRTPDGKVYVWHCPVELIPDSEA